MTTNKNLVKKMFMSILTAGFFAFSFSSCSDEFDAQSSADNQQAPDGAKKELLKAYGLTFKNFDNENDVMIVDADTTQLSISRAYAEKMGITSFVDHPMGIWHREQNLPYIRRAIAEKIVGDRIIVDVVPATVAEIVGDKKVNLQTDIYVNPDAGSVKTRAAGSNLPEYAAKFVDEDEVLHPAYVHLTDPYGYDTDYDSPEDQPSAAQTRAAASGEYEFMTAEEIVGNQTRWGCHNRIISFEKEVEKKLKLAVGKDSKDSVYAAFNGKIEFGINYFLTIDGGVKWNWVIPEPYLKKFEAGVDGNFGFEAGVTLGFTKEWELDKDKWTKELLKFKGYTFTFWVGPVPVAITTDPHLDVAVDGKIGGKLEMSLKYEYANSFKAGFGWADGKGFYGITNFKEEANDLTYEPPHMTIYAEAGIGFYLVCDLKIYGLAGPELGVGPRLGGELEGTFSPAEEKVTAKGKIALTVNAVIGAKVEVLGYKLAETKLTFPLIPDKEWVLWSFNWDLEEALHKSPKQQKAENQKTKYEESLKALFENPAKVESYETLINMLMELNGWDRQQAEEDIYNMAQKYVPNMESTNDMQSLQNSIDGALGRYNKQVEDKFNAYLIEKSWKEVSEELMQCPAYIENARHWRTYKMDINMDFLHRYFVSENGREPAKTAEDLKTLAYYVLTYSKLAYIYTPGYRSKFTGVLENLMKYGKSLGKYNDKQIEMAAYETMLEINMRYPAANFANLPWTTDFDHIAIQRIVKEYEWQLDRVNY